jgi:hypothetical protein
MPTTTYSGCTTCCPGQGCQCPYAGVFYNSFTFTIAGVTNNDCECCATAGYYNRTVTLNYAGTSVVSSGFICTWNEESSQPSCAGGCGASGHISWQMTNIGEGGGFKLLLGTVGFEAYEYNFGPSPTEGGAFVGPGPFVGTYTGSYPNVPDGYCTFPDTLLLYPNSSPSPCPCAICPGDAGPHGLPTTLSLTGGLIILDNATPGENIRYCPCYGEEQLGPTVALIYDAGSDSWLGSGTDPCDNFITYQLFCTVDGPSLTVTFTNCDLGPAATDGQQLWMIGSVDVDIVSCSPLLIGFSQQNLNSGTDGFSTTCCPGLVTPPNPSPPSPTPWSYNFQALVTT